MPFKKLFTVAAISALTLVSLAAIALSGQVSIEASSSTVKIQILGKTMGINR